VNRLARLLVLLLLTAPAGAAARTATLAGDLNPGPPAPGSPGSSPRQFATAAGRVAFVTPGTEPGISSYLLWSTDGTAAGTETLALLCSSSLTCREPAELPALPGLAFYAVGSSDTNPYLFRVWRTDGTRAGTYPISPELYENLRGVTVLGRRLLFAACEDSGARCGLWSTAGGQAERLRDGLYVSGFVVAGKLAYFYGSDHGAESGLWKTDGTAEGTELLREVYPVYLTASGSRVFFMTGGDDYPEDLWVSDGTKAGTRFIKKFIEPNHYFPGYTNFLEAVPGGVAFVGVPKGGTVVDLWLSDGTLKGTRPLTAFQGNTNVVGLGPDQIAAAGSRIFFVVNGLAGPRLWSTRGWLESTAPVPGSPALPPSSSVVPAGDRVVFTGQDPAHGSEPWTSDGTAAGTRILNDLCAGRCGSSPEAFTPHGGVIDFRATWSGTSRLVRTDGTAAVPLAPVPGDDSPRIDLADLGSRTFFAGFDATHGAQPWVTDGTPAGSHRIAALESSGGSSDPKDFTVYGNRLLFTASDGAERSVWAVAPGGTPAALPGGGLPGASDLTVAGGFAWFVSDQGSQGVELWRTDGTAAGTVRVAALQDRKIGDLRDLGGSLVFLVSSTEGEQPVYSFWTSDGTSAGTVQRVGLPADTVSVSDVTALGPELYYVLHREGQVAQVFRTDGTEAGTRRIFQESCDCDADAGASPVRFFRHDGQVWFTAWGTYGAVLLRTDGTAAGTVQILPAPGDTSPRIADVHAPFVFQDQLYYFARNSVDPSSPIGLILWKGWTPAEATPVKAVGFGYYGGIDPEWTVLGNRLFFRASDPARGLELWRTDGTSAGTAIVRDLFPGSYSGDPRDLVAAGGRLWFSALDPVHGRELWTSDGTRKGTLLVQDLAPGAVSSAPEGLTPFGGRLWFGADDGMVGREPWSLPLE
jgi:ELWxxDGT repeat protein